MKAILFHGITLFSIAVLLGYFEPIDPKSIRFGEYATDLLNFFNPQGTSRLWGGFSARRWEAEGFTYLGGGVLVLCLLATLFSLTSKEKIFKEPIRRYLPLALVVVGLFVFSLSNKVTFFGIELFRLDSFYSFLEPIPSSFRASGRFAWPFHYLVLTLAVVICHRVLDYQNFRSILILCILVQFVEMRDFYFRKFRVEKPAQDLSQTWQNWPRHLEKVYMVPPFIIASRFECDADGFDLKSYYRVAYFAAQIKMKIHSGLTSRAGSDIEDHCRSLWKELVQSGADTRGLYVIHPQYFASFDKFLDPRFRCTEFKGYQLCYSLGTPIAKVN